MASATPTRRVLADLNANTPLSSRGPQGVKSIISPPKHAQVGETSLQTSQGKARMFGSIDGQGGTWGAKRKSYIEDAELDGCKRRKTVCDPQQVEGDDTSENALDRGVREVHRPTQVPHQGRILELDDDPRTALSLPTSPVSPASSFESHDNTELDDSQNTTITIPEETFPPARSPLTREELRHKAQEMKLRLSLASYKVRTNQIDIPISRLEIRSSTSSKLPSLPRTTQPSSQNQTSRPSTASSIPKINLQRPSAEKKRPQPVTIPSSPPSYCSTLEDSNKLASPTKTANDATREGFVTPLLPRQRESLLNPPSLGSPTWGSDLTSSVVKGRAADGLLSLMRQHN